jgi:hypothetical protein
MTDKTINIVRESCWVVASGTMTYLWYAYLPIFRYPDLDMYLSYAGVIALLVFFLLSIWKLVRVARSGNSLK